MILTEFDTTMRNHLQAHIGPQATTKYMLQQNYSQL